MIRNALKALRWLRRGVILLVGVSVMIFGLLLVFTPIPAAVLVPVGLMILGTEFAWARVALHRLRARIARLTRSTAAPASRTVALPGEGAPPSP